MNLSELLFCLTHSFFTYTLDFKREYYMAVVSGEMSSNFNSSLAAFKI